MRTYDGIADAADDVRTAVLSETGLPPFVLDKVWPHTSTGASPVDLVVNFAEAVYANASACSEEARDIAAGCAGLCEQFGFHGMNVDSRGSQLALVLDGQTVENPPVPKDEFVAPAE